jgi:hypothetical protein
VSGIPEKKNSLTKSAGIPSTINISKPEINRINEKRIIIKIIIF